MNDLLVGLHRSTMKLYAAIRRKVELSLAKVSKLFNKVFIREAVALRRDVCDAIFWNCQRCLEVVCDVLEASEKI